MTSPRICVLGNNACAWDIADRLGQAQVDVLLAAVDAVQDPRPAGRPRVEPLSNARLVACDGQLGGFDLVFERRGSLVRRTAAAVVLAESNEPRGNHSLYGLKPAGGVMSVSALLKAGGRPPAGPAPWKQVVFLNGLRAESHPSMAADIMRAALQLQNQAGAQCCILTRNLKVAAEGLEALAHEARAAGVIFFKFAKADPEILQDESGAVRVRFVDEPTGTPFDIAPDLVVVDEAVLPPPAALELGRILGIESDAAGFLQADNVHRLPAATNRAGVIVAGAVRTVGADPAIEASNAALEALIALTAGAAGTAAAARIETGRCIRCLTCLRVCPYGAVALNGRPQVLPAACERCGICAAECPREAIRIAGLEREEVRGMIAAGRPAAAAGGAPHIVAFCCRRSAGPALQAAVDAGVRWAASLNVIEVPCAGGLAPEVVLSAWREGADGVLVLACHADNCHGRHGSPLAQRRTELAADFLARCGAGAGRLVFKTLAANMPAEAAAVVAEFSAALTALKSAPRPAGRPQEEPS